MSISIEKAILIFVKSAIETGSLSEVDEIYTINRLLDDFSIEKCTISIDDVECKSLLDAMDDLVKFAIKKQIITDTQSDKEIFQAKIMDHITPRPSTVNESFWRLYSESPIIATDFFMIYQNKMTILKQEILKKI